MNSNLDLNIIQSDETTVKVRFNRKKYVEVNRQNLLESSLYFQNILSSRFKDHNSEYVEVNSSVSYDIFEKAMQFLNMGNEDVQDENIAETFGLSRLFESNFGLELTEENIFDTFQLADYLQMDELKNWCLDEFSSSLDRNNVQNKFDVLKERKFPVEKFEQKALNFVEKACCGLYYIRKDPCKGDSSDLKYFSEESETVKKISCLHHQTPVILDLYCFSNTLVMCPSADLEVGIEDNIVIYDLITRNSKEIKLKLERLSVNCSNDKNMFVISAVQDNSEKNTLYIETFDIMS